MGKKSKRSEPIISNNEIYEVLTGKIGDRHDRGMIGDVEKNTDFRRQLQKVFWTMVGYIIGGNITILYFGYKFILKPMIGEVP